MSGSRSAGFTLVELLVVLAVLTLILAVVPSFLAGSGGRRADLTAAAREIAAGLREARSRALSEGHGEAFVMDGAANGFRIGSERKLRHLPPGLQVALITPESGEVPATAGTIRFFADGSSTGGRLQLRNGPRHADIAIDWLTGHVTLDARAD